MEVCEVGGGVSVCWVIAVAHVARRGGAADARLATVELRLVAGTARVGRLDGHVERCVDERRIAALWPPGGVVAGSQSEATPSRLSRRPRRDERQRHGEQYDRRATTRRHLHCQLGPGDRTRRPELQIHYR